MSSSHEQVPTTLAGLKKRARKLKKEDGITHTKALEQVAREMGYDNYKLAHKALTTKEINDDLRNHPAV